MISTISQHKINTNCLNQYNKNFKKLKTSILKSVLISLVFGKTLVLGKSMESLSISSLLANQEKYKLFTTNKKTDLKGKSHSTRKPFIRQKIRGQVFFPPILKGKEHSLWKNLENGKVPKGPQHLSNNIWGLLLFSREDLAFINLRGLLSTLLKALQVCLFALLNNKRIIFVGDAQPLVEEHHQRLLSCFMANQAKVFTTTAALKLPPILPSPPTEPSVEPKRPKKGSFNSKSYSPKLDRQSSKTPPLSFSPTVKSTGFGTSGSKNQYLLEVQNSIFGSLHALINTEIAKPKKVRAYDYAPAIGYQPRIPASANVLTSGQSAFVKSAKAKIELPGLNKRELSSKKASRPPLATHKSKAKTVGENFSVMEQLTRKSPDLTFANASTELSLKEKLSISQQSSTSIVQEKFATTNKSGKISSFTPTIAPQQFKESFYEGKLTSPSSLVLQSKQKLKWIGFQTNRPLYFESTKMEEGFCLKKNFKQNRVSNTVDLRQRLGLSSNTSNNIVASKIIEKSVPFNTSPGIFNNHTNFNAYNSSTPYLKGSFVESQPLVDANGPTHGAKNLGGKTINVSEPANVLTNHLSSEINNLVGTALEKITGQDSVVAIQPNSDSNFMVTHSHFYTEMARLVSKAAIRNSQWTATLAQPTNYWIGGFFSNSSATYKQNLSSTTLLNIKMDTQAQLQQFRDLDSKSKLTSLNTHKGGLASQKALFDLKKSKSILIAALAKSKAKENEKELPKKEVKRLDHSKNIANSLGIAIKVNKADVLMKAPSTELSNKEEKKLFFEKSFFSITTGLPLADLTKLSVTHNRPETRAGSETLKDPVHLLDSISEFSGGLWSAIYAPVARKNLANQSEAQEFNTQRKLISKSFRGRIPAKIKILKKQKGRRDKGINKRIIDHCLNSINVNKAKNAWLSEADLVFFANPEKNLSLLNQINRLKIPTIGIINSGSDLAFPFRSVKGPSLLSAKQTITYPIIGNSSSLNFLRIVLTKFACVLSLKRA